MSMDAVVTAAVGLPFAQEEIGACGERTRRVVCTFVLSPEHKRSRISLDRLSRRDYGKSTPTQFDFWIFKQRIWRGIPGPSKSSLTFAKTRERLMILWIYSMRCVSSATPASLHFSKNLLRMITLFALFLSLTLTSALADSSQSLGSTSKGQILIRGTVASSVEMPEIT